MPFSHRAGGQRGPFSYERRQIAAQMLNDHGTKVSVTILRAVIIGEDSAPRAVGCTQDPGSFIRRWPCHRPLTVHSKGPLQGR